MGGVSILFGGGFLEVEISLAGFFFPLGILIYYSNLKGGWSGGGIRLLLLEGWAIS